MVDIVKKIEMHKGEFVVTLIIWCLEIPINLTLWFTSEAEHIAHAPTWDNILICLGLYVSFLLGYLIFYWHQYVVTNKRLAMLGLFILTLAWSSLSMMFFFSMVALMATIVLAQLVSVIELRWALLMGNFIPAFSVYMNWVLGDSFEFISIILYCIINTLALVTRYRLMAERAAKNESLRLVRELKDAQLLLSASTKRDERLRIARDLHDTLGHQLTALSLQLEVASHVPEKDKQGHIKQAQAISRLLLSGVRDSVSQIRHEKDMELSGLLQNLTKDIPGLKVNLNNQLNEVITDTRKIEVIYRCVQEALTNISRHAHANYCTIGLKNDTNNLFIDIKDNGKGNDKIIEGNGLKGMKERVENVDGKIQFVNSNQGFQLTFELPLN